MYKSPPAVRPIRNRPNHTTLWITIFVLLNVTLVVGAALLKKMELLVICLFNPNPWIGMIYWWRRRGLDGVGWGCLTFIFVMMVSIPVLIAGLYGVYFLVHFKRMLFDLR
jgi:hypothetical protein